MRCALSFVSRTRQRAQGSVEYGLVLVGGALLAVLGYTLFSPIVRDAATQIQTALGQLR
jgi:hypothetical protein